MLALTKLQATKNELTYRRNYGKIAALITYVCSSVVERRQDMMGKRPAKNFWLAKPCIRGSNRKVGRRFESCHTYHLKAQARLGLFFF